MNRIPSLFQQSSVYSQIARQTRLRSRNPSSARSFDPPVGSQNRWVSETLSREQEALLGTSDYGGDDNDNQEEISMSLPWKTLLERPARAAWRVTEPHPPGLDKAMTNILKDGNRTPKQLKRAHRKVLDVQTTMTEFRERERRRIVNGKYYRGKDAVEQLEIHPVYYGYDETLATLKHRLLPNFAITKRVLEECRSLLGPDQFQPERIIDFGIGCGSASAAALDLFPDSLHWVHGIDPSQPMRDCSQRLIEGMASNSRNPPRVTFSTGLSADSTNANTGGSFDLALCTYTATDLPDITSTLAAAALLFEKLKPNGVFVMIEPGTPDGFNSIRAVRNMLLDCCPPDDPEFEWDERCHIIAPCTHNGQCPMVRHKKDYNKKGKLAHDLPQELEEIEDGDIKFDGIPYDMDEEVEFVDLTTDRSSLSETDAFNSSFCSFVQTIPGSDSRKGEKFSYLVAQKRVYGEPEASSDSFPDDNVSNLLALARDAAAREDADDVEHFFSLAQDLESRYLDVDEDELGLELLRRDAKRGAMGRIIRAPIKKKGHVYIDYCAAPGRIIRGRVAKSSGSITPGTWNAARKSRWGGLWPDTMDADAWNDGSER